MSNRLAVTLTVMMVVMIAIGFGTDSDWAIGFGGGVGAVLLANNVEWMIRSRVGR